MYKYNRIKKKKIFLSDSFWSKIQPRNWYKSLPVPVHPSFSRVTAPLIRPSNRIDAENIDRGLSEPQLVPVLNKILVGGTRIRREKRLVKSTVVRRTTRPAVPSSHKRRLLMYSPSTPTILLLYTLGEMKRGGRGPVSRPSLSSINCCLLSAKWAMAGASKEMEIIISRFNDRRWLASDDENL